MAVTNHWLSFLAHKIDGKTEFIVFDSRNIDYMKYNEKEIWDFTFNLAKKRAKEGRKPWSKFKIKTYA